MKGWDVLYAELLEKTWKEKMDEWGKRPKGEERLGFFSGSKNSGEKSISGPLTLNLE